LQAFKPANVDLPEQAQAANPLMLVLPDTLNEHDLLGDIPDPSLLLAAGLSLDGADHPIVWGTQMIGENSIDSRASQSVPRPLDNDDLDIELGDDDDLEFGRDRAESDWRKDYSLGEMSALHKDDLDLDTGLGDGDLNFGGDDINMTEFNIGLDDTISGSRIRRASSPLSDIAPGAERDLEKHFNETSLYDPGFLPTKSANRAKRRKVIQADSSTEISGNDIRTMQIDRSRILKPSSFLPRDPLLFALLTMQRNGGFISSILGDGRAFGWAPELRDVISVELVRKSGDLKRKRDSGVADMYLDDDAAGLEIPADESIAKSGLYADGSVLIEDLPADDGFQAQDDGGMDATRLDNFDETTMPLLHPADDGPISQGTKHAVHLLRNHFSGPTGEALTSPTARKNASVAFAQLLPQKKTSRSEATRMFFEVLVLATKDAIKVDQKEGEVAAEIKLRPKRGLWGEWAELGASGQLESEEVEVV
jgi:cohesin complex subunit SCC1